MSRYTFRECAFAVFVAIYLTLTLFLAIAESHIQATYEYATIVQPAQWWRDAIVPVTTERGGQ